MKHKLVIGLGLLILVLLVSGITFSRFRASSSLAITNQFLAKFVFEAEETDDISIPLSDLSPGDSKEYNFSVTNNKDMKNCEYLRGMYRYAQEPRTRIR